MKKIFLSFALIVFAISSFAQSFSVDSRSLIVPKFADQAAIGTAFPTPTTGTLVYDNALNQYAYYNGTTWVNFPAASVSQWQTTGYYTPNDIQFSAGNVIIGNIASNRFLQIQNQSDLATSLELLARSSTNQMRFTSLNPSASINQKFVGSSTAAASTFSWNRVDLNNNNAETPLMSIQGNGNLTVNGFSKFGLNAPSIKTATVVVTTATVGNNTIVALPSGVISSKIISIEGVVRWSNRVYPLNFPVSTLQVAAFTVGADLYVFTGTNSTDLANRSATIYITYIE
ncbi:hypothetical protein GCM10027035_03750 [Emticicia sediminis]